MQFSYQFLDAQPDLNYRETKVVEEMKVIILITIYSTTVNKACDAVNIQVFYISRICFKKIIVTGRSSILVGSRCLRISY